MIEITEFESDYTPQIYGANSLLTPIEAEIYEIVKSISKSMPNNTSNLKWTPSILREIGDLGLNKGYSSYPSKDNKALLYDLVWSKKTADGFLESIELILESEITHRPNHDDVRWDFEKLLLGNATTRVMICFSYAYYSKENHQDNMTKVIEWFNDIVKHFKNGEQNRRILVIIIDDFGTGDVVPHVISY